MPRAQIKDEKMYTELRGEGASKEKAARIANQAAAATSRTPVVAAGNAGFPAATRLARGPAARLALNVSPLGILDLYELDEVEIKGLDPKQRPVQGGLIKIGGERRVRAVGGDRESLKRLADGRVQAAPEEIR